MFNYGTILRQFREAKGMTLKEVADGIVSVAFLSKVERNISVPNMDVLFRLLKRMRVMQDEYLYAINQEEGRDDLAFVKDLADATIKDDTYRIKGLMEKAANEYNKTQDITQRHLFLTAATEYALVKKEPFNIEYVEELRHYLLNVDDWTRYEVVLYNNNLMAFNVETVDLLTRTAIDKSQEFIALSDYRRALIAVVINAVHRLLEASEYKKAKNFLVIGKGMITDNTLALERTELNFLEGLIDFHYGKHEQGIEKALQAINVLQYFKAHDWAKASVELWEEKTNTVLEK
jgi:Rgg/GadR/MutR family transcriptional activator